jgi:hypothetical protein
MWVGSTITSEESALPSPLGFRFLYKTKAGKISQIDYQKT